MDAGRLNRLEDFHDKARISDLGGGLADDIVALLSKDGIGWIWDDEEDLRRFLRGGLAAK